MDLVLGIAAIGGLSLFWARRTGQSASLGPLLAVAACMVWHTLWGVAGLLWLGGLLWYMAGFAALGFVVLREKRAITRLLTPGFVFFVVGSLLFLLLFCFTQPRLTQWDEFTFWGTAAKATVENGQLYTTAHSNLIARTYPPGLIVFGYFMQFFTPGPFSEFRFIASYAVLYMAAFAAAAALWDKTRAVAAVAFAGLALLPFFFETGLPVGSVSLAYLSTLSDMPMGALFAGALCWGLAYPQKDTRFFGGFAVLLAALTNCKDMGLAFALLALMMVGLDLLARGKDGLQFAKLRGLPAWLAGCGLGFVAVAASYLVWFVHLQRALRVDRGNVGPRGQSLSQFGMLVQGFKALLGIEPSEKFNQVSANMAAAFVNRRVSLLGSGAVLLCLIAAVLAVAFLCAGKGVLRRRILVFAAAGSVGFAAFYLFNIFTYTFIFARGEAVILKDYDRYIGPYWMGWLAAALVLLAAAARAAFKEKTTAASSKKRKDGREAQAETVAARPRAAALAFVMALAVTGGMLLTCGVRGNLQANVLYISPSQYTLRDEITDLVGVARAQGMQRQDVVYLVSQGDDSSRFYLFGYTMEATLRPLYGGPDAPEGARSASLVAPDDTETLYAYPVPATPAQLGVFLKAQGCTHVFLDRVDDYILEVFGPRFSDGLAGFDALQRDCQRYYRIVWDGGDYTLVPEAEVPA